MNPFEYVFSDDADGADARVYSTVSEGACADANAHVTVNANADAVATTVPYADAHVYVGSLSEEEA